MELGADVLVDGSGEDDSLVAAEANRYAADLFLGPAVRRHPRPLLLRLLRSARLPVRGGLPRGPLRHRGAGRRRSATRRRSRRAGPTPSSGRPGCRPSSASRSRPTTSRGPPAASPGPATPAGPSSTASSGASKSPSEPASIGRQPPERPLGRDPHPAGPAVVGPELLQHDEGSGRSAARRPAARSPSSSRPVGRPRGPRPAPRRRAARSPPAGRRAGGTRRRTRRSPPAARTTGPPRRRTPPAGPARRAASSARASTTVHAGQAERRRPPPAGSRQARCAGFEQGQLQLRPVGGQHQPGQPAAAAEVEDPAGLRQPRQQGAAVLDVAGHRPRPEKAEVL